MVAEALHCIDYESDHVADRAISPTSLLQPQMKIVIITMHSISKAWERGRMLKASSVMEKQAYVFWKTEV